MRKRKGDAQGCELLAHNEGSTGVQEATGFLGLYYLAIDAHGPHAAVLAHVNVRGVVGTIGTLERLLM